MRGFRRADVAFVVAALIGVLGLLSGVGVHIAKKQGKPTAATRLMIVGDSITMGEEGDYTWRYRLWQHLQADHAAVNFVGPTRGAWSPYYAAPDPASTTAPYRVSGWDSDHDAVWGLQMHQAMTTIQHDVATYRPDVLMVALGSDDLQQKVSDPAGLVADLKTFITNARAAEPNIKILVGTVAPRANSTDPTIAAQYAFLAGAIIQADVLMAQAVTAVSTAASPVRTVDLFSGRDPATDTHDGVHPNGLGEYKIAAAFAKGLAAFGIGSANLPVPQSVPPPTLTAPSLTFQTVDSSGIQLRWSQVQTADAYWIYKADTTAGQSLVQQKFPIAADHYLDGAGPFLIPGHQYTFAVAARYGDLIGPQSAPETVTYNP